MRSNIKIILLYAVAAGLFAALTSPIPGTSLLLTGLEILMIVHLARRNNFELSLKTLALRQSRSGESRLADGFLQFSLSY